MKRPSREFLFLLLATLFFGSSAGIFLSTLNNYLSDVHALDASSRGWLEFPRELPGFSIMFVAAGLLSLMKETRMAAVAMIMTGVGALGLGFIARDTVLLVVFISIWSLPRKTRSCWSTFHGFAIFSKSRLPWSTAIISCRCSRGPQPRSFRIILMSTVFVEGRIDSFMDVKNDPAV